MLIRVIVKYSDDSAFLPAFTIVKIKSFIAVSELYLLSGISVSSAADTAAVKKL